MTDPNAAGAPVVLPSFATNIATALLQKGFGWLAVALTAHGALATSGQQQFIEAGVGFALGLISIAWTYFHEKNRTNVAAAAANAPAAVPPVKP